MRRRKVTDRMESDLRKGHEVKEALKSFFLSGGGEKVEECGICLSGRRCVELGEEAVGVVLQALLTPLRENENFKRGTALWLCEDCGASITALTDLFLQLEELRCQFNDLRRKIGGQVIVGCLGRSEEEWVGWEEELKAVEYIFPSCVFSWKGPGGKVKEEEEDAASECTSFCDFLEEEELEEPPEDVKLKTMIPVVLVKRLEESNATEVGSKELLLRSSRLPAKRSRPSSTDAEDLSADEDVEFVPSDVDDSEDAEDSSAAAAEKKAKTVTQKPTPNSDGRFQCPRCEKTFVRAYHMQRHIAEVHEGHKSSRSRAKRLGCSFCERLFTQQSALLAHEAQVHSGCPQRPKLLCSHCDMTFLDPLTFTQHKLKTHFLGSTSSGDSQCPFCLKFFHNKVSFTQHQKNTHFGGHQPPKAKVTAENDEGHSPQNIFCFVCGPSEGPLTPEDLKAHEESEEHVEKIRSKASVHCNACRLNFRGDLEALRLHLTTPQHQTEVDNLGEFDAATFCVPCRKNFGDRWLLETHTSTILHKRSCGFRQTEATEDPNFDTPKKCPSCPKVFDFQVLLDRHIRRQHAPSGYSCKLCGLSFAHRKELLFHRHSHKDEIPKDLICEKCGKSFEKRRFLSAHMQIAHEGPPSLCDFCEKPFPTPLALQNHVRSFHSDAPSCACPHCPATFKVPLRLRKHSYLTHPEATLQDTPHPCLVCFLTFPTESELEGHSRAHAHLKCPICGRQFQDRAPLNLHLRVHTKYSQGQVQIQN